MVKKRKDIEAEDGDIVSSKLEKKVDDYLSENNILHEVHPKYPGPRRFRADFKILKTDVYIEVFGVKGDEDYDARAEEKEEYAEPRDMQLIKIRPMDLETTFSSVSEMIREKIEDAKEVYPDIELYEKAGKSNPEIKKINDKIGELVKRRKELQERIDELKSRKNQIITEEVEKKMSNSSSEKRS